MWRLLSSSYQVSAWTSDAFVFVSIHRTLHTRSHRLREQLRHASGRARGELDFLTWRHMERSRESSFVSSPAPSSHMSNYFLRLSTSVAVAALLPACATHLGSATTAPSVNAPAWLHIVRHDIYDGVSDDLVTAGFGVPGVVTAKASYQDPSAPTYAELRRAVLLRPPSVTNGFGRTFGPNIDPGNGQVIGDGGIAGDETLAYADDGSGQQMEGLLLQVPRNFDPARACIVATATPGSSNVWGDALRSGYWGLLHGCAVVWTDKGLGAGVYDIDTRQGVGIAGDMHAKNPRLSQVETDSLRKFRAIHRNRLAYKWANSGWTQEAEWGHSVLRAVQFALWELGNRRWPSGGTVRRDNTRIIATGFSNGGGAVLKAAEQDIGHLLDGVVAMSPQIMVPADARIKIEQNNDRHTAVSHTILDKLSFSNLYNACAALALPHSPGVSSLKFGANRCASLAEAGMLSATTTATQAQEALDRIHEFGMQSEADGQIAGSAMAEQSTLGQASQYGRFSAADHLCGLSFAPTDQTGRPREPFATEMAQWFASQTGGTPDGTIVKVINDLDPSGPRQSSLSISASTGRQDYNFDAALCLRELAVGSSANARRVQSGLASVLATANIGMLPTLIVHGRADPVEPPDFTSRAYIGLNSIVEGKASKLRYIEVKNATHGDPNAAHKDLVPLSPYQVQALEALWAHLDGRASLPPNQIVRATAARVASGGSIKAEGPNLPPITLSPSADQLIHAEGGIVVVPD